jgi:hypothetical protein
MRPALGQMVSVFQFMPVAKAKDWGNHTAVLITEELCLTWAFPLKS